MIFAYHGYPWLIHRLTYRRTNHAQPPRARLQGGGHDHDAVRHGHAQRHRPLPPRHGRHRPGAGPRARARRTCASRWSTSALRAPRATRASTARTCPRCATGPGRPTAGRRACASSSSTPARAASSCGCSAGDDAAEPSATCAPDDGDGARRDAGRACPRRRRGRPPRRPRRRALPRRRARRRRRRAPRCGELSRARAAAPARSAGRASTPSARALPGVPAVACFDTAFHATLPAAAATYALPRGVARALRRCAASASTGSRTPSRPARARAAGRGAASVVTCHLGAGASLAAVRDGRCVDTTMGFTPLEGLVMATRSGTVDPGWCCGCCAHGARRRRGRATGSSTRRGLLGPGGRRRHARRCWRRDDADARAGPGRLRPPPARRDRRDGRRARRPRRARLHRRRRRARARDPGAHGGGSGVPRRGARRARPTPAPRPTPRSARPAPRPARWSSPPARTSRSPARCASCCGDRRNRRKPQGLGGRLAMASAA